MAHDANTLIKLREHAALGRDIIVQSIAYGALKELRVRPQHLDNAFRVIDGKLQMLEGRYWVSTEGCALKAREPKRRGKAN
jgi:hypothetical protein